MKINPKKNVLLQLAKKPRVNKSVKTYVKKTIDKNKETNHKINVGSKITYLQFPAFGTWYNYNNDNTDSLTNISRANGSDNRIGDDIKLKSVDLTLNFCFPPQSGTASTSALVDVFTTQTIRCCVVQMKRGFTVTELLTFMNTNNLNTDTILRNDPDVSEYCHVLKDFVFTSSPDRTISVYALAAAGTTDVDDVVRTRQGQTKIFRMKIKPRITLPKWATASSTAVAPDIVGAIHTIFYVTDDDPASFSVPTLPYYKRAYVTMYKEF